MKVATVADVHVGNHKRHGGPAHGSINARCKLTIETLQRACDFAEEEKCTHFVIAGDLFDVARPEPPVIAAVQRVLTNRSFVSYVLVGNHDRQSHAWGDNALAPLSPVATIIEKPERIDSSTGSMLLVPHQPGNPEEWLTRVCATLLEGEAPELPTLLVMHMGIKDEKTPPWLQGSTGAIDVNVLRDMLVEMRIGHALAGDWHEFRAWKGTEQPGNRPLIAQIGALCPTGWDNPGTKGYGSVMIWDVDDDGAKLTREEVPGPRFVKVGTTDDREKVHRQARGSENTFFISESVLADEHGVRMQEAIMFKEAHDNVMGWEVVPDQAVAKAEAQHAASLARSAETFDEALNSYVSAMPMDDSLDRQRIVERCKEYLKP